MRRRYGFLAAIAWLALFLVAAPGRADARGSGGAAVRESSGGQGAAAGPSTIFVARRGWHVDVGFAVGGLIGPMQSLAVKFPGARYLFFGFGDQRYLLAKHHAVPATLAALWPGAGLILVTGLSASPVEAFGAAHVLRLTVSAQQASAAENFIWESLEGAGRIQSSGAPGSGGAAGEVGAMGDVTVYADGPYEGSLYFAARPRYSAFHTCNTWAAETLRAAGLPVRSRGIVFAGQIWRRSRKIAAEETAATPAAEQGE